MDEDYDDYDGPDLFVNFATSFSVIRVLGNKLVPTTFNIKTDLVYDETQLEDEFYIQKTEIVLAKIRYWLEHIVNHSVAFDRSNEWAGRAFINKKGKQSCKNNLFLLPEEPTEELFAQVLQSKFQAFGGKIMSFGFVEVTAADKSGLTYIFTGDGQHHLPDMLEWVGQPTFFEDPWWARDDASTMDVIPDKDADLTDLPKFAYSLDFIADTIRTPDTPSARIIKPNFRPKLVQGGQDG